MAAAAAEMRDVAEIIIEHHIGGKELSLAFAVPTTSTESVVRALFSAVEEDDVDDKGGVSGSWNADPLIFYVVSVDANKLLLKPQIMLQDAFKIEKFIDTVKLGLMGEDKFAS